MRISRQELVNIFYRKGAVQTQPSTRPSYEGERTQISYPLVGRFHAYHPPVLYTEYTYIAGLVALENRIEKGLDY